MDDVTTDEVATNEVAQLRRELDAVRRDLAYVWGRVQPLVEDEPEPEPNGKYPKAPQTTWHDVEDWVVNIMQDTLERRATNTRRWCPQWYKHPEVLTRFRILYEAYREVQSLDAVSYSLWFTEHLDRHLDVIFSEDGPFAACSPDRHSPHRGLTISRNKNAVEDWGPRPVIVTNPTPASPTNSAPAIRS